MTIGAATSGYNATYQTDDLANMSIDFAGAFLNALTTNAGSIASIVVIALIITLLVSLITSVLTIPAVVMRLVSQYKMD